MVFWRLRPARASSLKLQAHEDASPTFRPNLLLLAISCALAATTCATTLIASPAHAANISSADQKRYSIAAGKLSDVLAEFAATAGVPLSFAPQMLSGLESKGLEGSYSPQEGFAQLLKGSGHELVDLGNGSYSLRKMGSDSTMLQPTTVSGTQLSDDAFGPVYGYVAKRSATATKTDTPLIETPRSISVITREQIEAQRPITMQDALGYTPGIFAPPLASSAANSTSGMSIRGFSTLDGDAYYQDGMRAKFAGWWGFTGFEPYAYERIEVLRGPASTLYGQGQPNGTINLVSKRPTITPVHEVGIEGGSFDHKQLTADLGGALDSQGEWSYRVTALVRDSDTQIDYSENNRDFFAASLAWRPSDRTELILQTGYQRNEGEPNNNLPIVGTLLPNSNGKISRHRALANDNSAHYENKYIGWLFEHQVDDTWTLRSNLRLNQQTGERQSVRNGGYLAGQERLVQRNISNYESMDGNYNVTTDNQAQAKFSLGNVEHTALIGMDFARQKDGWQMGGGTAAPVDIFDPIYTPVSYSSTPTYERTANDQQYGLYIQDQMKIDDHWVVSIGGRKDWAKSWEDSGTPDDTEYRSNQKDDDATWQTGVAYLFDNGITPYLSYSESFVPVLGTNYFGETLKPETGRQYEAGIKYQPANQNLSLTAAAFDIRKQNVTTMDPAEPLNRIQTGEVSSRGFELEARAELAQGLNLIGTYAYTHAKVSESNDGDVGKDLLQSPRDTASLWVDYAFSNAWLNGLTVGVGGRYIGKTWADTANTVRVPDYTIWDMSVQYDLGRASAGLEGVHAYLNVKNLEDKTYMTCSYDDCLYGLERSMMAGVRYSW